MIRVEVLYMEDPKTYYNIPLLTLTVITGLVAGVFGSLMGYLLHYLHFTEIKPSAILAAAAVEWKNNGVGMIAVSLLYGLFSIIAALVYYALLRKRKSFIWGAAYGAALYFIIFFVVLPLYPNAKSILTYDVNTILTGLSSFILYGVFIGYSISYEYEESMYVKKLKEHS
jgi:uncharacterized membrane protein YagU involved in acid resistance